jgi:hypothetical protein
MYGANYSEDCIIAETLYPDIFRIASRKRTRVLEYLLRFYLIEESGSFHRHARASGQTMLLAPDGSGFMLLLE